MQDEYEPSLTVSQWMGILILTLFWIGIACLLAFMVSVLFGWL